MAIAFDELDDYYSIADEASLTLPDGDWCVAIWTYVTDNTGTDYQYLLSNNDIAVNNSFNLYLYEASADNYPNDWRLNVKDGDGTNPAAWSTLTPGADSTWRLIVCQRDTAVSELQLWFCEIGGTAVKEASPADTGLSAINGGTWNIGRRTDGDADRYYGSIAGGFLKGDFALSQAEIEALAVGVSIFSLGYEPDVFLPMIEAVATLRDLAGSNDATRYSAPTTAAEHCPVHAPGAAWHAYTEGLVEITPLAATAIGRTRYAIVVQTGVAPVARALSNDYWCTVANGSGVVLGQLDVQLQECVWRLNDVGKARFTIARTDSKATARYLAYGNRIAFEFANGLPVWGGILDVPASWAADGTIEYTAYSPEYVLSTRRTGKDAVFLAPVGTIYQTLIESANAVADTGIVVGSVWSGGGTYAESYHGDDILKVVTSRLQDLAGCDWAITTTVENGVIQLAAHLYQRRGAILANVALIEGHNLTDITYIEQGPIVNVWICYGAGSTWDDSRLVATAMDSVSIGLYGRREDSVQLSDIATQTQLDAIAAVKVAQTAYPKITVTGDAVNLAPAAFSGYGVGDVVAVFLHSYGYDGYDGQVRIVARGYSPETGKVKQAMEEYRS